MAAGAAKRRRNCGGKGELAKYDNEVDFIVTHECSSTVRHFIDMDGEHHNLMTRFFDELTEQVRFQKWFFGCYHMDKVIPPRYYALFPKWFRSNKKGEG